MPKGVVWYELPGGPAALRSSLGKSPHGPELPRGFCPGAPAGGSRTFLTFQGFSLGGGLLPTGQDSLRRLGSLFCFRQNSTISPGGLCTPNCVALTLVWPLGVRESVYLPRGLVGNAHGELASRTTAPGAPGFRWAQALGGQGGLGASWLPVCPLSGMVWLLPCAVLRLLHLPPGFPAQRRRNHRCGRGLEIHRVLMFCNPSFRVLTVC